MTTPPLDWPALMRAGIVGLGLPPAQFWALTPAELRLMLDQGDPASVLTRNGLAGLMATWPDGDQTGGIDPKRPHTKHPHPKHPDTGDQK
jgi:uncharacterized phage protein (TIGR02216 family)